MIRGCRKKGKAKPEKYGIVFDSIDEIFFYEYCLEAKKAGLLKEFIYHPSSIEVFPAYVEGKKTVLHSCTYTPDFIITGIHDKLKPYFRNSFDNRCWIDVKGSFIIRGESKFFSLMTKVMWHLHNIFINKVVVKELCEKTFVPELIRYTDKTKQLRTAFKHCKTLEEFLHS